MKKTKSPLLSPSESAAHSNRSMGRTTIGEAIDRNHFMINAYFFEMLLERDDYPKLLDIIRPVTSDLTLQGELQQSWESEVNEHDKEMNILLKQVRYACLYAELARAAKESKNHNEAWAFNNYSSLMTGQIMAKSEEILSRTQTEERSNQNSKNAQGRNKYILLVKEEAARLLEELRPTDGWPSKVNAIAALEGPLAAFIDPDICNGERSAVTEIKTKTIGGVTATNIANRLTTWLREDAMLRYAWEKNMRPQKNQTK